MTAPFRDTAVVILAGGASRRMGTEKALLPAVVGPETPDTGTPGTPGTPGTTLIERHLAALAPAFGEVIVSVAHGGPSRELATALARARWRGGIELALVADAAPRCGPLEGLRAGLEGARSARAFVVAVDLPAFDLALVGRLLERLERPGREAVIPRSPHGPEPACAVYRRSLLAAITGLLGAGRRALRAVADLSGVELVDVTSGDHDLFTSLNTRDDYARWRARGGD